MVVTVKKKSGATNMYTDLAKVVDLQIIIDDKNCLNKHIPFCAVHILTAVHWTFSLEKTHVCNSIVSDRIRGYQVGGHRVGGQQVGGHQVVDH